MLGAAAARRGGKAAVSGEASRAPAAGAASSGEARGSKKPSGATNGGEDWRDESAGTAMESAYEGDATSFLAEGALL